MSISYFCYFIFFHVIKNTSYSQSAYMVFHCYLGQPIRVVLTFLYYKFSWDLKNDQPGKEYGAGVNQAKNKRPVLFLTHEIE